MSDNNMEEIDSPRVKSLNKAINVYVESLFDAKSFANATMRAFIPFYAKDEGIKSEAMAAGEGIKESVCQEICDVVKTMEVERKLKDIDEKFKVKKTDMFVGLPEKQIRQKLYNIKKKTVENKRKLVDQEYDRLVKEMENEVHKFETTKTLLENACSERDDDIHIYKEKLKQITNALPDDVDL